MHQGGCCILGSCRSGGGPLGLQGSMTILRPPQGQDQASPPLLCPPATPSCTFPAEGKFPGWPGLPAAPEFPVFEEAGREKGLSAPRLGAGKERRAPFPDVFQLCPWEAARSLSKGVGGVLRTLWRNYGSGPAPGPLTVKGIPLLPSAYLCFRAQCRRLRNALLAGQPAETTVKLKKGKVEGGCGSAPKSLYTGG